MNLGTSLVLTADLHAYNYMHKFKLDYIFKDYIPRPPKDEKKENPITQDKESGNEPGKILETEAGDGLITNRGEEMNGPENPESRPVKADDILLSFPGQKTNIQGLKIELENFDKSVK